MEEKLEERKRKTAQKEGQESGWPTRALLPLFTYLLTLPNPPGLPQEAKTLLPPGLCTCHSPHRKCLPNPSSQLHPSRPAPKLASL